NMFHLFGREARVALDPVELPALADLSRRPRIVWLAVGVRAAAEAEEVVIESLLVGVDLRPALVAHAAVPGSAGVHARVLRLRRLAGHHLVDVAGQVVDAEVAHALGLR